MQNSKYFIKKEFLDTHKYQQLVDQALIYENLFKDWLGQIAQYYKGPLKPPLLMGAAVDKNLDGFAQRLQNQIYPFIHSLSDISNQHLSFVAEIMRQSAALSLQRDVDKVIQSVKKLDETQSKFESANRELLSSENRLILHSTNNIQFYFFSNWFKRLNALQRYNKAIKNLQQSKPDQNALYKLSEDVQSQLLEFRKKILNYKYGYLKQGVKIARKLLNCLAQYLAIAYQMLIKTNGKLRMEMMNDMRSSNSFNNQESSMQQFQQNYAGKAQAYREMLINLQNIFIYNENPIDPKVLFNQFNEFYAGNQQFITEMFDVFMLFENVGIKRRMMHERMTMIIKKIQLQFKEKKKTAQILNTLNKRKEEISGYNLRDSLRESGESKLRKSQAINKQFGLQNIQKSIAESIQYAMEAFRDMSRLCHKITQKSIQVKKTDNNMSISYEFKDIKIKNKRPSKNQLWLWRDWREFKTFQQINPKYDQKFIANQLIKVKRIIEKDEAELQTSCQIQGRHSARANLEIFPQKINILSKKDNAVNILLPITEVDSVEPNKKRLLFRMSGGAQVKISGFKNINEVQSKISEFLLKKDDIKRGGVTSKTPAKPAIQITPQQLQAITKRAPEMQAQKQKMDDYIKYGETTIPGASIQQVYEHIFSDKGSSPLNKNLSFFANYNIKNGNTNFTETKYDKEGPYFYTGTNKDITFVNCPLISTRTSELDHPLPPIPFIPKTCHCKSQEKIYWISNKELEYKSQVYSYGAQMMQTFYTVSLYKIKQADNGVNIQIWCKIVFFKETRMKSILYNGGVGEIKNLIPAMIKEIEAAMKVAVRERNRQSSSNERDLNPEVADQENKQLNKVGANAGTTNKSDAKFTLNIYLIAFVIGTLLINLLLNMIF